MKQFSIIIPHRDGLQYLPKLFSSIPDSEDIEIIIVDNSIQPITKEQIGADREYCLLYSSPERHAGGARNVGIDNATGKWILFLDADDYFADGAFECFFSKQNSEADIIFTGMGGVYLDTGEPSDRGDYYTQLVRSYIDGTKTEEDIRCGFASPCCKMIRHELISMYNIRFDEIVAGNDQYFSLVCGYYARKIEAIDCITYIATVTKGSLTRRRDFDVIQSRLYSKLHCNEFFKTHGMAYRQQSVLFPFFDGKHLGFKAFFKFSMMILRFKQNPFIGMSRWLTTYINSKRIEKRDSSYITK